MADDDAPPAGGSDGDHPPVSGPAASERVQSLVEELTRGEKRVLIKGDVDPAGIATGYVPAIDRLDVPGFSMVDGPMGIRAVTATAFPATVSLAASWDRDLAREFGETIGTEARGADQDALLAPGVNIARVPQCGRNFEYYSEDPRLTARLSTAMMRGVQSRGVMATVKHYVANNQETDRHEVNAVVPDRALRELYLPAFEAAVKDADVASVMAAYNRVNGTHATENHRTLTEILREDWGFSGFVVSDWWSITDGPAAVEAGLDLDMPGPPVYEWHENGSRLMDLVNVLPDGAWFPKEAVARLATAPWQPENPNPHILEESHFGTELTEAIDAGRITEADLDRMVARILGQYERFGLLPDRSGDDESDAADGTDAGEDRGDDVPDAPPEGAIDAEGHAGLSRRIAERGAVLLENDGTLPLSAAELDSLALIGPNADEPKVGGGGSSEVDAIRTTPPAAGLREVLGDEVELTVERGLPRIEEGSFVDSPLPDVSLPRPGGPSIGDAVQAARDADVAVVIAQDAAHEGADHDFQLPGRQNELIARVAAAAERTVVVLKTASAVAMPWRADVDAILEAWYPGQADGLAVASVLAGEADPSGRLPVSFGESAEDYPGAASERHYPGVDLEVEYGEGIFVGYRHFDEADVEPAYPFGHGESYADFEYADVSAAWAEDVEVEDGAAAIDPEAAGSPLGGHVATVTATIENVADRAGREVVQVYAKPPGEAVDRAPRELVGFAARELESGEEHTVEIEVPARALAYWDESAGTWAVEAGEHVIQVGRSSRDVRGTATLTIEE